MKKEAVLVLALACAGSLRAEQRPEPAPEDVRWTDPRFCGFPVPRDADGSIHRSTALLAHFKAIWPCPEGGAGACPGWGLDHVIPLTCGGCDALQNLQWLKLTIKSCAGTECKDRWEQKVYCR